MSWIMLGVVVGVALAVYAYIKIQEVWQNMGDNPTIALLVAVPVFALGIGGGGWVAQWLVHKYDRRQRRRQKAEREQAKFGPKKKKK